MNAIALHAIAFINRIRAKVVTTTMMPDVEKLLYSKREAAYALGISIRSVDYMIADKKLLVRRLGGRVLIPASEVRKASRRDFKPRDRHKHGR
jgi:excisionase family DNA binding protein